MKSGETGVVILEHDIDVSQATEIIITLSSIAGSVEKRLSQHEIELKSSSQILIPLSQDDTVRLSRKTDTEVRVEGQIVFGNASPPTVAKTKIDTFRLEPTLNTEYVPGAEGQEGQYNAISISCHAGVIYAKVDMEEVESIVTTKVDEALENSEVLAGKDGKDGADGKDGKDAYESAVDGGYTGTEEEFNQALAGVENMTKAEMLDILRGGDNA